VSSISVDYDVLNQKGSPAWYSDLFANIPTPGYKGRMFISTDTFAFYRDNGTGWDLTGGPGTGTITGSGVNGQVTFFNGSATIGGSTNLVWDNTNNRLGINVASPTVTLEISGSVKATALIKSGGTSAQILLADGTTTPTSTFQAAITLTTTGTTGASTLSAGVLNVPTYTFVSSVNAITLGTSGTDLTSTVANSTTTPTITLNVPTASATNRGALSSADWTTFNNKQATITLTTSGTSGAATLVGATLNIPNYTNVGTVTSVAALTLGTSGTDLSSTVANSTSTPVITLNVPTASATNRGALSSADWTTFNNKQATINVTAPVVLTGATISMPAATTSVNGYLTSTDWNTFNNKSNTNGTVTSVVALTIGTSGIDITSTAVTTTTTPVITLNIPTASASNRGALSSTDWTTFNNKQATLSLTTTGTSGAATLVANTLNVPNYGSALSGYLPLSGGTLTGALGGTSATFSGSVDLTSLFPVFTIQGTVSSPHIGSIWNVTANQDGIGRTIIGTAGQSRSMYFENNGDITIPNNTLYVGSSITATIFDSTSNAFRFNGSNALSLVTLNSQSVVKINAAGYWGTQLVGANDTGILIDNTGFVGIKTTSPNAKLDLGATAGANGEMFFVYNDSTTSALSGTKVGFYLDRFSLSNNATFTFATAPAAPGSYIIASKDTSGTTLVARVTVLGESGNVGIGSTNPTSISTYKTLEIQGSTGAGIRLWNGTNGCNIQHDGTDAYINNFANGGFYLYTNNTQRINVTSAGINNYTSRGNYLGATDNALFSLNSGGTLYTVGFSPTATASSTNTLTLTTGTTTWIYTGTGTATWTLPNPSGNNQIYWIKNAGTGAITLTAFSGTNIINNSAASVSTISIAVGATAVIAQDGNVKSYQLQ